MNKRFEAVDKKLELFAESMHRLENALEKILARPEGRPYEPEAAIL